MDKKDAAFALFEQGFAQKDIAQIIEVHENTITDWKKIGDWDSKISSKLEFRAKNIEDVEYLISYQLRTLKRTVIDWESKDTKKLIEKGEIDALSKLYATIKTKDMEWAAYIRIMQEFMEYLSSKDLPLAKQLTGVATEFLSEKQKSL
jgi:repressor of nif and glnA expression